MRLGLAPLPALFKLKANKINFLKSFKIPVFLLFFLPVFKFCALYAGIYKLVKQG
jgi:hypothetical protein